MTDTLREHRVFLLALLAMAIIVAVYWQSFARMIGMWPLLNYEHCWLALPVSLYVLWRKRHDLAASEMRGSALGVLATALVVLVWIIARSIGVQAVEFVAATLLIFTFFWAVGGNQATQNAAVPLLLLLAAVPVGEILVEPLMHLTADVSSALLYLAGVPVFRDGTFLTLPGGSFEVAEVCSGLRFLLAGGMASVAYAYVTYTSFKKRVLFVSVASAVMVLANGVRAFIVMYVASATDMRVFTGRDHVYFGMVLFAIIFLILIFLGERHADPGQGLLRARPSPVGSTGFPAATAAVALLLILVGPGFQYTKARQPLPAMTDARLPELPGCVGPIARTTSWSPEFHGADYQQRASYTCGEADGNVYVAGYLHQTQGKELITSANRIWPYDWRRYVDESSLTIATESGPVSVRQAIIRSPERSMLIWYWYRAGETITASTLKVKVLTGIQALALRPREASVTAVALSVEPSVDPATLRDAIEPIAAAVISSRDETP